MRFAIRHRDDKIVSGGLERDEIEPKQLGGRSNADTHVGLAAGNGPRHIEMRPHGARVTVNVRRIDACGAQTLIEQKSRS